MARYIPKFLLLIGFLFVASFNLLAQQGSQEYLLQKRGFKIFKLGYSINNYSKYIELLADEGDGLKQYYVTNPDILKIGRSIKVDSLIISAYRDTIMSISLFIPTKGYNDSYSNGDNFLSTLTNAYGKGKEIIYHHKYKWETINKAISLIYNQNGYTYTPSNI